MFAWNGRADAAMKDSIWAIQVSTTDTMIIQGPFRNDHNGCMGANALKLFHNAYTCGILSKFETVQAISFSAEQIF